MNARVYLAELLGTFLFMMIGYSSVAAFVGSSVPGLLVVPFSFGLGLLAAIFAFGHISGATTTRRSPSRSRSMGAFRSSMPPDTSSPRSSARSAPPPWSC